MPEPQPVDLEPPIPKAQREHIKVQQQIKRFAQEQGFVANVEVPTLDGGLVDLLIEKNGKRTAIEVSVFTPTSWEIHNVQKCLAAGFEHIIVCCTNVSRLPSLRERITECLSIEDCAKVRVHTVQEIEDFITSLSEPQNPKERTMKGYRVKVQYDCKGINADDILRRIAGGDKR